MVVPGGGAPAVPTGAPVVIGFDDTIERRWGAKSKGHFVKASGLRWLSAMLLVKVPWADRVMALPFLTVLAPSKRFYADKARAPKTLLEPLAPFPLPSPARFSRSVQEPD